MGGPSTSLLPPGVSNRSLKQIVTDLTSLYIKNRTRISRTVYAALVLALIHRVRSAIKEQKAAAARATESRRKGQTGREDGGKKKVELNREFFRNLGRLLKICIPSWKSKEARMLLSHSVFLVLRTLLSLYVAELDGQLVSSLVRGKGKAFLKGLVWWQLVAIPGMSRLARGWSIDPFADDPSSNFHEQHAAVPSDGIVTGISNETHETHSRFISW